MKVCAGNDLTLDTFLRLMAVLSCAATSPTSILLDGRPGLASYVDRTISLALPAVPSDLPRCQLWIVTALRRLDPRQIWRLVDPR